MDEGKEQNAREQRDEIFSKAVRAGKRTYFFDVKTTRGKDLYLTITESKKKFSGEGKFFYEKHKLFLYKEDFEKFEEGFRDCINRINALRDTDEYSSPEDSGSDEREDLEPVAASKTDKKGSYTDVSFDDLGSKEG